MNDTQQIQFMSLYEPVHHQLSKFCRAISGNKEDAEDLMNDTIVSVIEHMDKINNKDSFKWYLFKTASNLNRMKFRRSKFRAEFDEKELQSITDSCNNPELILECKMIYEEILSLPARTSETLILHHISDLSLEEIQKIQGGSLSGVKLRLKRGRAKLLNSRNSKEIMKMATILFF